MKELTPYMRMKDAPHHNKALLNYMKRNPNTTIWMQGRSKTLKGCMRQKLRIGDLRIGAPNHPLEEGKGFKRSRAFYGRHLSDIFRYNKPSNRFVVGYGEQGVGVYWIDVTERLIKEYAEIGPCAFSDRHHHYEEKKTVRTCLGCGHIQRKKTITVKKSKWLDNKDYELIQTKKMDDSQVKSKFF